MLFHDPLLSSRGPPSFRNIPSSHTPLPHRNPEQKVISGKPGNRRYYTYTLYIMCALYSCII